MSFRPTLTVTFILGLSLAGGCNDGGAAGATTSDGGAQAGADASPVDGGGASGLGSDSGNSGASTDAGAPFDFTPEVITPIVATANTSFSGEDVIIHFGYGLIKVLQPGDEGVEGRTFDDYEAYLLVLAEKPIGCEQEISEWRTGARVEMYFWFIDDLPLGGIYPEVTWTDRHPTDPWRFNVNSATGNITGSLTDVTSGVATGTVESTGTARMTFSGNFEVTVCD